MQNEAHARIRINKLLEEAGWRFFDDENGHANILLENHIKIKHTDSDAWGNDFELVKTGSLDFLLVDEHSKPVCVLEAKKESLHPLTAKEQARAYAQNVRARYIILSNGIVHFLWDLTKGNPTLIAKFPSLAELQAIQNWQPNQQSILAENVTPDYIATIQMPDYATRPEWLAGAAQRQQFIWNNNLRFLRPYQVEAVQSIQQAAGKGQERFLLEMATGTGKTLTAAAIIRLFLRTQHAHRVLFLVDRLELETQAKQAFDNYLKPDYTSMIYKTNRSDWRNTDILVTTIQSLLFDNKFRYDFSPTNFDLLISDESHRTIAGNARAVFEYFHGYKLGLTATPRDYLKGIDFSQVREDDPREIERRTLRDTYATFHCESNEPTFRYSLLDGVQDGHLLNPQVIDARTEITTKLLSDEGYAVNIPAQEGEETQTFISTDFEKKFFSDATNRIFCSTFLQHALRDPITNEIGKTIIFAVSQNHARKITEILNEFAELKFPHKYNSDFAVQVTSQVVNAQQMTKNFANDKLNGHSTWLNGYKTDKTRVCVTVGMMTTGYDCPALLNLCMMRPIFSPTDFVQMKGRGTRKHTFEFKYKNQLGEQEVTRHEKTYFKLFDFFANYEYFEEKFDYDVKLMLPKPAEGPVNGENGSMTIKQYTNILPDPIASVHEETIGLNGMKIDRMLFQKFADRITMDDIIKQNVELDNWDYIISYIQHEILHKPEEYFSLENLRKAAMVDRKLSIREIVEKIFGIIPKFKSNDEMLDEEFDAFISIYPPDEDVNIRALRFFFKAYIVDAELRRILKEQNYQALHTHPTLNFAQFKNVAPIYRETIPQYITDYVKLERFAA